MMARSFKADLALVGAGDWGRNLVRNFYALGALHTICDNGASTLARYRNKYESVRKTPAFNKVLRESSIRKVAIAAPAAMHYQMAKEALLAGKDVFVEKPLCLHESEAEELAKLAEVNKLVLMVGHLLQYHPCIEVLQSLVNCGKLGKLYYITSNRLNLGKIRREENALWSFAPHDISVILSLAGNHCPDQVICTGDAYLTSGVPDTTLTALRFPSGIRAHIYVSWLNPFKEQKLTVVGSDGMAVFDDTRPWCERLLVYRQFLMWKDGQLPIPNHASGEIVEVPEREPLRNECQHFLECCRERRQPKTDAREGLRVLRILHMAQASLDQGGERISSGKFGCSSENWEPKYDAVAGRELREINRGYFAHPTAVIDPGAEIGEGTKIWHFAHISAGARIGKGSTLGQNTYVGKEVVIGNNVKVQNNVSIYKGTIIEDDVFLGPSCVMTNISNPRAQVNRHELYERTLVRRGASIGANATIVCGVTLGRYCFISAGAVVTKDVPDYALVMGVPARQKAWMSRHGHILDPSVDGIMRCPESNFRYQEIATGILKCLDLDEEASLPPQLAVGKTGYDELKPPR